ncbi:arylamine N-acetyltransferase family protein [Solwaraspora sp. WMMB762]|uniref:arylamine N-acetyltransferase family protein n=1 Tax=Solwaraspora sp. WMMB762 TaxID=3404120 RepID=UPI003B93B804
MRNDVDTVRPLATAQRDEYLARLGMTVDDVRPLDEASLRRLVAGHLAAVPFDNSRIHRGEVASVDPARMYDALITRAGGGICYELNGCFAALLASLGVRTWLVAGTTVPPPGSKSLPLGHAACVAVVDATPWIADVGFGGEGLVVPLPEGPTRLATASGAAYDVDPRPRALSEFEAMAWWHSTNPGSRLVSALVVSKTVGTTVTTLSGRGRPVAFSLYTTGGPRTPLSPAEAARVAFDVFRLPEPLPGELIRYAPLDDDPIRPQATR